MSANTSSSRGRGHQPSSSGGLKPLLLVQQHVAGPSHIALFLTNLRLLDLDLRDDWPDITAVTLSTKDAQQNQRKRIQAVEWALYQLFQIWDPEETKQKLAPFFPPLEPIQSLNLRAALLRCLEQTKKAGALGRDTVLRKTMLDECKGERLDEVLSVFSTIVLKKVVHVYRAPTSIAHHLAFENFSYTGERTPLTVLIMAHKVSLRRALAAKNISKADYDDFESLLDLKERQITRRHEQLKVTEAESLGGVISDRDALHLQRKIQNHWTGNDEWLETILHGDSRFEKYGILGNLFRQVWMHVETGSLGEIEDQNQKGLLEQLDSRVREQNYRLSKWKDFHKSLKLESKPEAVTLESLPRESRGVDLGLNGHQSLQLTNLASNAASDRSWEPLEGYDRLLKSIHNELTDVGKHRQQNAPLRKRQSMTNDQREEHFPPESGLLRHERTNSPSDNSESDEPSPGFERYAKKSASQTPPSDHVQDLSIRSHHEPAEDPMQKPFANPARPTVLPPPLPAGPTDSPAASDILASVLATSPSPTKPRHVLSLAERTRLSMHRAPGKAYANSDSDDLPELPSVAHKLRRSKKSVADDPQTPTPTEDTYEDLVSRTRQSMAGMAEIEKKVKLERRRSMKAAERNKRESRTSYFPKQLEPTVEDESFNDGIATEKLIEDNAEADYESVFKTRPKIKTSPVISPMRAWGDMGGGNFAGSSSPGG